MAISNMKTYQTLKKTTLAQLHPTSSTIHATQQNHNISPKACQITQLPLLLLPYIIFVIYKTKTNPK